MGEVPLLLWRRRRSSRIHAAGEREIRIFKGFRLRLGIFTERGYTLGELAATEPNEDLESCDANVSRAIRFSGSAGGDSGFRSCRSRHLGRRPRHH